jgi:hypothetical protein
MKMVYGKGPNDAVFVSRYSNYLSLPLSMVQLCLCHSLCTLSHSLLYGPAFCVSVTLSPRWSSSVSITHSVLCLTISYGPALYLSVSLSLCVPLSSMVQLCVLPLSPLVLLLTSPSLIPLSHRRVVPLGDIVNVFYRFFFVTSKPIINSPALHCLPPQITSKKTSDCSYNWSHETCSIGCGKLGTKMFQGRVFPLWVLICLPFYRCQNVFRLAVGNSNHCGAGCNMIERDRDRDRERQRETETERESERERGVM